MLKKLLITNTVWLLFMAVLLFLPAGTLNWPTAWIFLLEIMIAAYGLGFWLYRYDPALLNERLSFPLQKQQKAWDKIFIIVFLISYLLWLPLMALDVHYFQVSNMPLLLEIIGAVFIAVCMFLCYFVFKENTFAAPTVKIQTERKQKVITTGPYAIVRHPMYASATFYLLGTPLLLGSWLGLVLGFLFIIFLMQRAIFEENSLKQELEGYAEYMQKVRYRMIPGIW